MTSQTTDHLAPPAERTDRPSGPARAVAPARRRRPRGLKALLTVLVGTLALLPVLSANAIGSVTPEFFGGWDHFSESLVLAKIESTTPSATAPAASQIGLVISNPNPVGVFDTFDGLHNGGPTNTQSYSEYRVQLGLQGYLFTGLYSVGCHTVSCLETVNAGLTGAALIGFALLLGLIAPRSLSVVFVAVSIGSPWIIASARNLYWSPWSFFLPAIAAICFALARTRRARWIAAGAVLAVFMLRFGMGFEFLTTIALFAASMPLLAWAFGRGRRVRFRGALLDAGVVLGISVLAFAVMLVVTCLVTNRGDLAAGLNDVYQHAAVRTYGGTSTDPVTAASLAASPISVLGTYVFGWTTGIVDLGWGAPLALSLGPHSLFPLIAVSAIIVLRRLAIRDDRWRRDLVVLLAGLAAPISWFVLAKSHAYVHLSIDYLLWYLLGITSVLWIPIAWLVERLAPTAGLLRRAIADSRHEPDPRSTAAARPRPHQGVDAAR